MSDSVLLIQGEDSSIVITQDAINLVDTGNQPLVIEVVSEGPQGPQGPTGPQGPPGPSGIVSSDGGNALTHGSDGGLYCSAVLTSTIHW